MTTSVGPAHEPVTFSVPEPAFGEVVDILPGLRWTRLPLPMKVGHTNVYLLADADGWAIVDTGFGDARSIATWQALLAGPLAGERVTKIIVTHAHIDHIGAAGWLCRTLDAPLHMSQIEFLTCRLELLDPGRAARPAHQAFLRSHGVNDATAIAIGERQSGYADGLTGLPDRFVSVHGGDVLTLGGRRLRVLLGPGHSPAQVMLSCADEGWLISADQLLKGVQPLLILPAGETDGDPYELLLRSLDELEAQIDPQALVLPGHYEPYFGFRESLASLREHHRSRCVAMVGACRGRPHSAVELASVLFRRDLDPRQLNHALSEVVPYANRLVRERRLRWVGTGDGIKRLAAV